MRIITIIFLLVSYFASAQEDSFPCKQANPKLKSLFSSGQMDYLYILWCSGDGLHGLTSSYLKASREAPKIIGSEYGDPPDDSEYVAWTCRYTPGNLQDKNPATAWVEGEVDYGVGEVVIVPSLDLQKPVEIWSGYGKSDKLFQYHSRPSRLKLYVIEAKLEGYAQYGNGYKDLKIIKTSMVKLMVFNGYQIIEIPSYSKTQFHFEQGDVKMDHSYFLGIEIMDVYPGTKWKDTCISEIRNTN